MRVRAATIWQGRGLRVILGSFEPGDEACFER
jgi:hypothetical protein